jgi:hypothetical protein
MGDASVDPRAAASVRELRRRMERSPSLLKQVAAMPLPSRVPPFDDGVVMTGVGMSEGVARFVAGASTMLLRRPVQVAPFSTFLSSGAGVLGRHLVIFSQALSPNAHLALSQAGAYASTTVVTSLRSDDPRLQRFVDEGGVVFTVPPVDESGFLVRVLGPRTSALAGLRLALQGAGQPSAVDGAALEQATAAAFVAGCAIPRVAERPVFLAEAGWPELVPLLTWTWMEALWVEAPAIYDALQLVHGAWQRLSAGSAHDAVALRQAGLSHEPLWDRVQQLFGPSPHRLVHCPASLTGALAFFEHAAFLDGLMLSRLEHAPKDLEAWPGKGTDGVLYDWTGLS